MRAGNASKEIPILMAYSIKLTKMVWGIPTLWLRVEHSFPISLYDSRARLSRAHDRRWKSPISHPIRVWGGKWRKILFSLSSSRYIFSHITVFCADSLPRVCRQLCSVSLIVVWSVCARLTFSHKSSQCFFAREDSKKLQLIFLPSSSYVSSTRRVLSKTFSSLSIKSTRIS